MKKYIKYESIKNSYITKEQAVAIACSNKYLKDSIYKKNIKESNLVLGFISFNVLEVALVKIGCNFGWHIKVQSGTWGGTRIKKIPILGIKYAYEHLDGDFDESNNISCLIMCDSGEYYFGDEIDLDMLEVPNMVEYNKYVNLKSIYHM